ncbi:RepB family protein, partial [Klebsiella pneumoniae]
FVKDALNDKLQGMCEKAGRTQAEMIELLIQRASVNQDSNVTTSHS